MNNKLTVTHLVATSKISQDYVKSEALDLFLKLEQMRREGNLDYDALREAAEEFRELPDRSSGDSVAQ